MKLKELLDVLIELYPNCSFELEGTKENKTLKFNPQKKSMDMKETEKIFKIHPFKTLIYTNNLSIFPNSSLQLLFEFKEE